MIEAYSNNVTVAANQPVPFNSVSIAKGCCVVQQGVSTFLFNECGVYKVHVDASGSISGTTAGNVQLQLYKNGVPQPQANNFAASSSATDIESISFDTFVQVPEDNSPCCCASPTTIQILTGATANTFATVNITIDKVGCCC